MRAGSILKKSSTSCESAGKLHFGKREHGLVPTEIAEMQTKQGKNIRPAGVLGGIERVPLKQTRPEGTVLDIVQQAAK